MKQRSKESVAKAKSLLSEIQSLATTPITIMEVCGTHTVAIAKNAIRELLPTNVRLVSGPGCPVCVTANGDIDCYLYLAGQKNVITATFGDMIRVPGSEKNLQQLRAEGADIRVVYSTPDALELARQNPGKEVVFLGVGFETTVPTVAVSLDIAKREGIRNYSVLSMHKVVPPVLKLLAEDDQLVVDAFLDPGHVCSVIGIEPIKFMAEGYGKPGVVTGFEALDILEGIVMLLRQRAEGRSDIEIQYRRVVKPEGNPQAKLVIERVFKPTDALWRGIGLIPESGLAIREDYSPWDAARKFSLPVFNSRETPGCRCGDVLRGIINPTQCPLFAKHCTPMKPVGPCMVSSEGSCAAYHRYAQRSVD
ncbi:hydrogenase expression/formation protein HypD [Desulfosporosinus orientis DSM 765]|uniref:Hydrogenase expression/formation protein HypD n=1 Tax=Desulfosporosinus orientis (strain ATCC 19365 / DSM 765 / NCIMB 8382 / VKM B-1628 / Singapore I) TaxID=768706 RepID=G7WCQ3_DESOD|nr:hydrogenase formation protein HypD [Desulfosporosinus orientis]AET66591.1 hydrogenase expression/formation protein HypD [Desulfosporosinus orientis DSM 765]